MDTYPNTVTSITKEDTGFCITHTVMGFKGDTWVCDEPIQIYVSDLNFMIAANYLLNEPYKYKVTIKRKSPKILRRTKKVKLQRK